MEGAECSMGKHHNVGLLFRAVNGYLGVIHGRLFTEGFVASDISCQCC